MLYSEDDISFYNPPFVLCVSFASPYCGNILKMIYHSIIHLYCGGLSLHVFVVHCDIQLLKGINLLKCIHIMLYLFLGSIGNNWCRQVSFASACIRVSWSHKHGHTTIKVHSRLCVSSFIYYLMELKGSDWVYKFILTFVYKDSLYDSCFIYYLAPLELKENSWYQQVSFVPACIRVL